ncbi:conserved protein of unknown function [Tenacibaculum sp. 190130A14a]|uniref:TPR_REGION domain-containing protein n=1 Tax=Tenacibaculum polynesiense TaxID=3137857 RepID=A0ABM9PF83_9FLAO
MDYEEIKILNKKFDNLKQYDSAIYHLNKFVKSKDLTFSELGGLYYRIGINYRKLEKLDSTYYYYKKSKENHVLAEDSILVAYRLFSLASIESDNELFARSDSTAIMGLRYLTNKKSKIASSLYNCLGINLNEQGKYKEAFKWYDKALHLIENKEKRIRYKNNIGKNYISLKKYDTAVVIYKELRENNFFDSIDPRLRSTILGNYAYAKFQANSDVQVEELLKSQRIKIEINDQRGLLSNYSYLSDFYKSTNKQLSLDYANRMYALSVELKATNSRIEALDKIVELVDESKLRDLYFERNFLKDSIIKASSNSQNKLVKVIYNNEELEKQKLKAQLNAEQYRSQKQQWIFIGLGSIIIFIIYFFYKRQKTQKEKVIEVYNTETRLAKKIHDELANDVYLAMNKVQQGNTGESLLQNLEKIYTQTRNISHENSPVVTGRQFETYLKQLFQDFTTDHCRVMSKDISTIQIHKIAKEKQIVMYRVLQELLVNMKKYSNASLVVIAFAQKKDSIKVTYKDNGIGVNTLNIKNGLQNMETRIKSIGGYITFETKETKGFQAKFQFKK